MVAANGPLAEIERIIEKALQNAGLHTFLGAGYVWARDSRGSFQISIKRFDEMESHR